MKKDENEKFNLETTEWIWEPPIHVLIAIDFFLCVLSSYVHRFRFNLDVNFCPHLPNSPR